MQSASRGWWPPWDEAESSLAPSSAGLVPRRPRRDHVPGAASPSQRQHRSANPPRLLSKRPERQAPAAMQPFAPPGDCAAPSRSGAGGAATATLSARRAHGPPPGLEPRRRSSSASHDPSVSPARSPSFHQLLLPTAVLGSLGSSAERAAHAAVRAPPPAPAAVPPQLLTVHQLASSQHQQEEGDKVSTSPCSELAWHPAVMMFDVPSQCASNGAGQATLPTAGLAPPAGALAAQRPAPPGFPCPIPTAVPQQQQRRLLTPSFMAAAETGADGSVGATAAATATTYLASSPPAEATVAPAAAAAAATAAASASAAAAAAGVLYTAIFLTPESQEVLRIMVPPSPSLPADSEPRGDHMTLAYRPRWGACTCLKELCTSVIGFACAVNLIVNLIVIHSLRLLGQDASMSYGMLFRWRALFSVLFLTLIL